MTTQFTESNFEQEVLQSDVPVVVDFYADWCGPCKMMSPVVEKLADTYADKVKIGKLNTDEAQSLAAKYGVMSIPNIVFFKNGEVVDRQVGAVPQSVLEEKIKNL
ncbi:thioredoxin [uncultured Pseudoramibacter sp.]|uniref:thioredoxin n=1 Tax=uncultured Pseudoramibacter sp. TaxID=1623493 RepID=UPI0025DB58C8|nr:thioredoxin [uncultured Pseudoramibacter sp.]